MKKTISAILCLILVLSLATSVFAVDMMVMMFDQQIMLLQNPDQVTVDNMAAVESSVTTYFQLYETLTDAQKEQVAESYKKLVAVEKALADLKASLANPNPDNPSTPDNPNPPAEGGESGGNEEIGKTGDNTLMFVAMAILSMTAMVVVVYQKKRF